MENPNPCPDCNSVNHNPECNECLTNEISNNPKRMDDIEESYEQLGTCHPSDIGYMIKQLDNSKKYISKLEDRLTEVLEHCEDLECLNQTCNCQ